MEQWSPKQFIDVKELARRTGMSVTFYNRLRCKGGGPPYKKIGASIRYLWGEADQWVRDRTRRSTDEPGSDDNTTHRPGDDDPKRGR